MKKNKKRTALIISIVLLGVGVIPLIIFTFYADSNHPYSIKQISLTSEDGTMLQALVYKPKEEDKSHYGVVVAHGFCGNKQYMQPLSIELVKRGFVVVAIDFRGHGSSDGYLPVNRRSKENDELVFDMMAGVEYLENLDNIKEIGLVGHSMGGRTSLNLAELYPNKISAVVSIGMISLDYNFSKIHNLMMAIGKYEQIFSQDDAIEFLKEYTNKKEVKIDRLYGDFDKGTATKAIIGPTAEHLAEVIDTKIVYETVQWFEQAFNGEEADDISLTLPYNQAFLVVSIVGVITLIFLSTIQLKKYIFKKRTPATVEKEENNLNPKKMALLYFLAFGIGAIFLFPFSTIFATALPVSMGNMLFSMLVGTAIGITIVSYLFVAREGDKRSLKVLAQNVKELYTPNYKNSLLFGILAAIIVTTGIASIMHWSSTATFLTAREIGAVVVMAYILFPFLLIKEYYFRTLQNQLKEPSKIKEYLKMLGIGILIDNALTVLLAAFIWQNSDSNLAFYALALTIVGLFSIIQQVFVTWIYSNSGRNILGSAVFLAILYSWMIVNFFPFGYN